MKINLKNIFTADAVAASLERLPALKTTMMDTLFPGRPTHPSATIGVVDLAEYCGTIPLVRRSGQAYRVGSDTLDARVFAPEPLKPKLEVSAADLNDLRQIIGDKAAINAWLDRKTDRLRRIIRDTTEAFCSVVATTGKLTWPTAVEGGTTDFEMDFGSVNSYSPSVTWDDNSATVADVYDTLVGMEREINKAGYGGEVAFMAGSTAFNHLLNLANSWQSTGGAPINVRVDKKTIYFGGYEVMGMSEQYKAPNGTWTDKVGAKKLLAYAKDANGAVTYLALDSVSAGLRPLPFHVHVHELEDDSGFVLIGNSKPVPVRPSKSLCMATVVSG